MAEYEKKVRDILKKTNETKWNKISFLKNY